MLLGRVTAILFNDETSHGSTPRDLKSVSLTSRVALDRTSSRCDIERGGGISVGFELVAGFKVKACSSAPSNSSFRFLGVEGEPDIRRASSLTSAGAMFGISGFFDTV
jgi:hypothetical protein